MGAGSHTGSEEGCNPDGTGINIGAVRLAVKDELDHREFWSGRWESNPTPNTAKLLNRLIYRGRLPSITVHNRRHPLDSFTLCIPYNMPINLKCCTGVG